MQPSVPARAAVSGDVRPPSGAPSEMTQHRRRRHDAVDALLLRPSSRESATASPIAVPSPGVRRVERVARRARGRSSAARRRTRGCRTRRRATHTCPGPSSRNALAARCAATSRVGVTSVALHRARDVDREHDVASCRGTLTCACGRAKPTTSAASASEEERGRDVSRSRPGARSTRFGSSARFVNARLAAARRRSLSRHKHAEHRDGGERRAATSGRSNVTGASAGTRRAGAASRRSWRARRGARRAQRARARRRSAPRQPPRRNARAATRCACRPEPDGPVSGSTSQSSPTFGSSCSRGSRISIAITSCRLSSAQQRLAPVERPAEVRHDDDDAALARDRAVRASASPSEVAPTALARRLALQRAEQAEQPAPALARRQESSAVASPNVTTPSRLPRRVATWPIAIATPSATSALRRSAVPNCIDGEVSSTSHVTSTRSARLHADVRLAGACGDVPLDPAHVVARHVRTNLRELGARHRSASTGSRPRACPAACERRRSAARGAASGGSGPGPGPLGCRLPKERCQRSRPREARPLAPGTAARTESRIVSALTPSASAW